MSQIQVIALCMAVVVVTFVLLGIANLYLHGWPDTLEKAKKIGVVTGFVFGAIAILSSVRKSSAQNAADEKSERDATTRTEEDVQTTIRLNIEEENQRELDAQLDAQDRVLAADTNRVNADDAQSRADDALARANAIRDTREGSNLGDTP